MIPFRLARRLARSTAGSAVVEAAIATPLMLMLTMGIVETARYLYANMTMQSVAAGAAGELARDAKVDVVRVADFLLGAGQLAARPGGEPDRRGRRPGGAAGRADAVGGRDGRCRRGILRPAAIARRHPVVQRDLQDRRAAPARRRAEHSPITGPNSGPQ
jgi:hypothetical protein